MTKPKTESAVVVREYVVPSREWDRATDLVTMFIATGSIRNGRAQNMMLISDPGSGKTELLERFQGVNPQLTYASDLTVRGLYNILRSAQTGSTTHIVATEFQKFFMRKSSTFDNTLGALCQSLEEGVGKVYVGEKEVDFGNARLGFIGAITHDTANDRAKLFRETGFLSRVATFPWNVPAKEMYHVMDSISSGDKSDLSKVTVALPQHPVNVDFPQALSEQLKDYTWQRMRDYTILRVFQRFRSLAQGCAILDGRDYVHARDIEKVVAFEQYWSRMVK